MIRDLYCQYVPDGEDTSCGAKIEYRGHGRPPKYCSACVKTYNVNGEGSQRHDDPGPETDRAIAATVKDMQVLQGIARHAGRVQRLAIGLATEEDPAKAAALVGVTYKDEDELAGLIAQAESDQYKALRELQPAAMTGLIMQTIALLLANARESAASGGSPSQTIAGVKGLVQSLEMLTGGASSVYGDITIVFPGMVEDA